MHLTYTATRRSCYAGSITQGISNNLAPILFIIFQTSFGLSYERLGSLILINFMTQLIVDVICVRIIDRVGYRIPIVLASALSALGLISLGILPLMLPNPYVGLVISVMISAIGGGLLEVLVSPIIDSLPTPEHQKASAMSFLHSFYCWGQVLVVLATTLLLKAIGSDNWHYLPIIWALIPLANTFAFSRAPLMKTIPNEERTSVKALFISPVFLAMLLLMLCSGAAELTISQWSSLFAERGLGLTKVWGDIAGPCMFAVLMGLGRIFYGIWGSKIKMLPFMACSSVLCIGCYLVTSLSNNPVFSLIGCALSGLSVSIMWPGTCSLSSARFPLGGAAMFGILAVFGDLGCSVGPWLAGIVADKTSGGLNAGILGGTIFPVLMIAVLIALSFKESLRGK